MVVEDFSFGKRNVRLGYHTISKTMEGKVPLKNYTIRIKKVHKVELKSVIHDIAITCKKKRCHAPKGYIYIK